MQKRGLEQKVVGVVLLLLALGLGVRAVSQTGGLRQQFTVAGPLKIPGIVRAGGIADRPIHFAIIGDRTGEHVPGIYEQIISEVERLKPDFVVTVGDAIEGYTGDTNELGRQWREYKSIIAPLTMPIYFTPGNHDITTDSALTAYERYAGRPFYSFDYQNLHFIVFDVSRWESSAELPKEELDWLANDLKKPAARKFVFFHKPFWFQTAADNKPDTLHSLFRTFGVDAVFNGHLHTYFSGKIDNILYTAMGSSGGDTDPGPTGVQFHFIWVTVDKNGISIAPIKIGSVLPWDEVTVAEIKNINRIALAGLEFEKPIPVKDDFKLRDNAVVLRCRSLSSDFGIDDTVCWELPAGWTVEPTVMPIKVAAGDSVKLTFRVAKKGSLYPTPTLAVRLPYALGKKYEIKKAMPVERQVVGQRAIKPVIDGKISESCWQHPATLLFAPDGSSRKIDPVSFYFAYDENNLYLAADCKESKMDSMAARATEPDGSVYAEDCVGYFFQPDTAQGIIYQIYFNPLGTSFDQKITINPKGAVDVNKAWNGTYEVKTTRGGNFWSIEARIPLDQFGVTAKPGQEWKLNFRRKQKRFNSSADWQVPISYDPKTFGVLILK
jgi:predicted phosphodiesterase